MNQKQIIFQNAKIHYKTTGKGLPVVLIHGFAEDSSIWDIQVDFLKNDYNLIIPDLPGSGRSELICTPLSPGEGLGVRPIEDIGIGDYAECIKQILDEEKIGQCIMIGHSMGGYISLAFAEKYPESLISFGLFHSSAYADDDAKLETRKKAISFMETNGAEAFLKTSIPGLFYGHFDSSGHLEWPDESKWPDELIEKGKVFTSKALVQYYKAMMARPDRTKQLKNSLVPVLFILGEHDKAVPFKHGLEQSHMPQQSYVHILRKSAHMGMLEESGESSRILANFLLAQ